MPSLVLKSVKASRLPNRINLIFSDSSYLPLFVDDYLKLSLTKGQEIDSELFTTLCQLSYSYLLRDYALRQVGLSPKTQKTLSQKLLQKKYLLFVKFPLFKDNVDHQLAAQTIMDYLQEHGLLDNAAYIDYVIRRYPNKAKNYLISYLQQQGIPPSSYSPEVFDKLSPIDTLTKLLLKKNPSPQLLSDANSKNKLIASFLRKGFALSDVKTVIDDYLNSK